MPRFELIAADAIPVSAHQSTAVLYQAECRKHLRDAISNGKALVVRLNDGERCERYREYLRKAAKDLGVRLLVTTGDPQTRVLPRGKEQHEGRTIYVRIFRLSTTHVQEKPAAVPVAVVTHPAPRGPLDGFKMPSAPRKVGRPAKPKFTIPTPSVGYQDLGHGIAVDR